MKRRLISAVAVMLILSLALASGCAPAAANGDGNGEGRNGSGQSAKVNTLSVGDGAEAAEPVLNLPVELIDDYGELYAKLSEFQSSYSYGALRGGGVETGDVMVEEAEADMASTSGSDAGSMDTAASSANAGYSGTNVQVQGIDEGDIVKTDGQYIYILGGVNGNELSIVCADGANTAEVSVTKLAPDYDEAEGEANYPCEMYVYGDRLAVIKTVTRWETGDGDKTSYYWYNYEETTAVDIYDISDRAAPKLVSSLEQDGWYNTSRMADGVIYVITGYSIYSEIDEGDVTTYVPSLWKDGVETSVASDCICILPRIETAHYTVVSSIEVGSAERLSARSVLGAYAGTVYMNYDNLYIARGAWSSEQSEPYTENQYTVVEYKESYTTEILRFSLGGGAVTLAATGSVRGYPDSQFSLDEYGGYLRIVTTINDYSYKTYTDERYSWTNYEWLDDLTTNALWVLNENLEVVGSVEDLAEGETVYSARFDGDIGYFVTFRQTDPLFAVDLSDPTSPTVLSELKIPGFSEYLHKYDDGLLLGLGMDADEETGITDGMKLSMFDISDPADVSEKHALKLDSYYSAALYNHKAILVSKDKNLIAFPTQGGYAVYGYSKESGFYLRASFNTDISHYNSRGLYIGDYIYICSAEAVSVHSLEDFEQAGYLYLFAKG